MTKKLKTGLKRILWSILKDKDGFTKIRTISGPAKGTKFYLDLRKEAAYWIGSYDDWILQRIHLEKIIQPGWTVWDCGAYVGYYSAIFRKLVGDKGKIYTFEGSMINYERLKLLPELNGWSNVKIIHQAIGPDHTTMQFVSNLGGELGPATKKFGDRILQIEEVKSSGVDELVYEENIQPPDFIKFDLETAEFFALKNGERVYREIRPLIMLEVHGRSCLEAAGLFLEKYSYKAKDVLHMNDENHHWMADYATLPKDYVPHMLYCIPMIKS